MTWSPERIAAVQLALDAAMPMAAQPHADWMVKGVLVEALYDAARIGLTVIRAEPETLERVARYMTVAISFDEIPDDWEKYVDEDYVDDSNRQLRAALAALKETT